jgi:Recombination endonuclease VII
VSAGPVCVDCIAEGVTTYRPTPGGGVRTPRCATHTRARRKRQSAQAHAAMIQRTYGITDEQYQILLAYQSTVLGNPPGTCAICGIANGKTKRLAVDHDHKTGRVRGVLCGPCNKDVIGRLGVDALLRAVDYLLSPPGEILS